MERERARERGVRERERVSLWRPWMARRGEARGGDSPLDEPLHAARGPALQVGRLGGGGLVVLLPDASASLQEGRRVRHGHGVRLQDVPSSPVLEVYSVLQRVSIPPLPSRGLGSSRGRLCGLPPVVAAERADGAPSRATAPNRVGHSESRAANHDDASALLSVFPSRAGGANTSVLPPQKLLVRLDSRCLRGAGRQAGPCLVSQGTGGLLLARARRSLRRLGRPRGRNVAGLEGSGFARSRALAFEIVPLMRDPLRIGCTNRVLSFFVLPGGVQRRESPSFGRVSKTSERLGASERARERGRGEP